MLDCIWKVVRSFGYAFRGIGSGLSERNMRIHLLATCVVIVFGLIRGLTRFEWMIVILLFGMVWSAELMNTAVEELADIIKEELDLGYKVTTRARDVAAGGVLIIALVSIVIAGIIVFV